MLITLPLYIMRELCKALGLALLVFSFVMLALSSGQVIRDGAGILTVISILPNLFPLISPMVLPFTIITGTLIAYGRLSSTNEYVAAQASGIHPIWISGPAFVIAILATSITLYLNDTVLTEATIGIRNTIISAKTEILERQLAKPGSFLFNDVAICRMERQGDRTGIDITFFGDGKDKRDKDNPRWDPEYPHQKARIIARNHAIGLEEDTLTGKLYVRTELENFQRFLFEAGDLRPLIAKHATTKWQAGTEGTEVSISPDRITYWGFSLLSQHLQERRRGILKNTKKIEELKSNSKANAATKDAINRLEGKNRNEQRSIYKLTAEMNQKLALSFSCLGFALLGIPLGLRSRSRKATVGFVYGLIIAVVYMLTLKGLHIWARLGKIPAATIWLPTIILVIAGVILWHRSRRAD